MIDQWQAHSQSLGALMFPQSVAMNSAFSPHHALMVDGLPAQRP